MDEKQILKDYCKHHNANNTKAFKRGLDKQLHAHDKKNRKQNNAINTVLYGYTIQISEEANALIAQEVSNFGTNPKNTGHDSTFAAVNTQSDDILKLSKAAKVQLRTCSLYLNRIISVLNKLDYRINNDVITSDYTEAHEALFSLVHLSIYEEYSLARHGKYNKSLLHHIYKELVVVAQWYLGE